MASSLSAAAQPCCFLETGSFLSRSGKSEARRGNLFPAHVSAGLGAFGSVISAEGQPFIRLREGREARLWRSSRRVIRVVAQVGSAPAKTATPAESDRWWSSDTIAVVTGGSKSSIGLEIVRKLSKEGVKIIFTSRSDKTGREALEKLRSEGVDSVEFHELDITNQQSIDDFASWLQQKHGGLDILVNNAGVMVISAIGQPASYDVVKLNFDVNYYGTKRLTEKLLPLLRNNPAGARVVNVCSRMGALKNIGPKLQPRISDPDLTFEDLDALVAKYLDDLKAGRPVDEGWNKSAYANSKVAEAAYTRILARDIEAAAGGKPVLVNAVCPGFCRTDLGNPHPEKKGDFRTALSLTFFRTARDIVAPKSAEEGADTPAWVALAPPNSANGAFFSDREDVGY
ncbi:NAD(P)-binding Rossmann-fold superfamily protein [Klebsormidium nitens]|uniref:NAD(P)-binding Rossmann-fold superfamily protein n=1 Tax=Klebsormidium nitens TaxID=105231 RepID=A0A1Y1IIP0_KLENI|nr:NAD(P)-binding Rossmann-fold superfamily protein [Klebsormidium nitens]|eukprot:GAQ88038.1 NAD(P)-binding Rossmann-fold superfamily protein [Klebsormidium nitens]